jgi:ribulose-phosphate 3-epimerase
MARASERRLRLLRDARPAILPSLLLCDFAHLADEVRRVEEAGAAGLHLDVMDGRFVPNLTYGMPIVAAVRRLSDLPLDVHLMISEPARYVAEFIEAGADVVTIHAEAVDDPRELLTQIRRRGAAAGLALNPRTPLERAADVAPCCDLILTMSVEPGFGAQPFETVALDKLRSLRATTPAETILEVDGGVNAQTIASCVAAGAGALVVGSAIFRRPDGDYRQALVDLRAAAGA